jgi:hypothetical protein
MSLLTDIQDSAVGTDTPVDVLLRQCLVLAARLHHEPLRDWANLELNGYPADVPLPPYRKRFSTHVVGHLSGGFGAEMRGVGLPPSGVPNEELREILFSAETRQGVAAIQQLLASGDSTFQRPWPMDAVAALQGCFWDGYNLMEAHRVIPAAALASTLSGIRDRVLQFALDIYAENPEAGEASPGDTPIAEQRVTQIFNQTVYGDHAAVATGGRDTVQHVTTSIDIDALKVALGGLGIEEQEQQALVSAVREEGSQGPRAKAWLARLQSGAITLGSGITVTTAGALIGKVLGLS